MAQEWRIVTEDGATVTVTDATEFSRDVRTVSAVQANAAAKREKYEQRRPDGVQALADLAALLAAWDTLTTQEQVAAIRDTVIPTLRLTLRGVIWIGDLQTNQHADAGPDA